MPGETFERAWLDLRESVDHRSRSEALALRLGARWAAEGWKSVVDLGAGTGSNFRYLAPRLPGPQRWRLVDHDRNLLDRARLTDELISVESTESVLADLSTTGPTLAADADLVTASALLDLVSESWLRALVVSCESTGAGVLMGLTYDGSITWERPESQGPPGSIPGQLGDPEDEWIRRAVNLHQRGDKGFGPALGPAAADVAEALLRVAGYETWRAPSPWRLGPDDRVLASALIDGWARSAIEIRPEEAERVRVWAERQQREVEAGTCFPTVGHTDVLALPR